jgi:hypothetical protein
MRTSFHHQSEAQPPNGPLTAATSPDTPSTCPATQSGLCEPRTVSVAIHARKESPLHFPAPPHAARYRAGSQWGVGVPVSLSEWSNY